MGSKAKVTKTVPTSPSQPSAKPGGAFAATFLFFSGFLAIAAGLALAIGGRFSPEVAWYSTLLGRMGLSSGPVFMGGCVLFGMGMVIGRIRASANNNAKDSSESSLFIEQLAGELINVRDELNRSQAGMIQVRDASNALTGSVNSLIEVNNQAQQVRAAQDEEQKNALYRLAASMDQLGARVEERLAAGSSEQNHAVAECRVTLTAAQEVLEANMGALFDKLQYLEQLSLNSATQPSPAMVAQPAAQPEPLAQSSQAQAPQAPTPQGPVPNEATPSDSFELGLLDTLDDCQAQSAGSAPSAGTPTSPATESLPVSMAGEPIGALPNTGYENPFVHPDLQTPGQALGATGFVPAQGNTPPQAQPGQGGGLFAPDES